MKPKEKKARVTVLKADVIEQRCDRFAFDYATLRPAKDRIPLDYCHDENRVLGYCENFEIGPSAVTCDAVLFEREDSPENVANDVVFNLDAGVPYEASALISLKGALVETVPNGEKATVNGREVEGPLDIYYGATLRGVAVCPYGADPETAFVALSDRDAVRAASTAERILTHMNEPVLSPAAPDAKGLQTYVDEFGKELGVEYYLSGKTLDEARAEDYARLKANRQAPPAAEPAPEPGAGPDVKLAASVDAKLAEFDKRLSALALSLRRGDPVGLSEPSAPSAPAAPKSALQAAAARYSSQGTVKIG